MDRPVFRSPRGGTLRQGLLVGIEVKASQTVRSTDFKGLRRLAELMPQRFHRGIVLYLGRERIDFGSRLTALPITGLWSG